jgi:hypothetical protein
MYKLYHAAESRGQTTYSQVKKPANRLFPQALFQPYYQTTTLDTVRVPKLLLLLLYITLTRVGIST